MINKNKTNKQTFGTREEVIKWLNRYDKKYNAKHYKVNEDLSIDVNGHVDISDENLKTIPVNFGVVTGDFNCSHNKLTNLIGSPRIVGHLFWSNNNKLITLEGLSDTIGNSFICTANDLIEINRLVEANINGYLFLTINKNIFKDKELYNFLYRYFNESRGVIEIDSRLLKLYFQKITLNNKIKNSLSSKTNKAIFL